MTPRRAAATLGIAALLAGTAAAGTALALRFASPLQLELGPNDAAHIAGFREDWERDGEVRFRWTTLSSRLRFPFGLDGDGARLRLRYRRHFDEPADVRLIVAGAVVGRFEAKADPKRPYQLVEVRLPATRGPLELGIEATTRHDRPLGIALDWVHVERGGAFRAAPALLISVAALVLVVFAALAMGGASPLAALAAGASLGGLLAAGAYWDAMALDRIARNAVVPAALAAALAVGCTMAARSRRFLQVTAASSPWLVGLVLLTLAVRLTLLLHPRFYYPDVRIHALFAGQLASHGWDQFLTGFTENQFRYSLGLQFENGHWYAFPYPPLFYVLCVPLIRAAGLAPEVAVSALASLANALEVLVVFALGRRVLGEGAALRAAALLPVLPIFAVRASLAYFPALFGHAIDALLLLLVVDLFRAELPGWRDGLRPGLVLGISLLAYTQGLLNFGLLLPALLLWDVAADGSGRGRGRQRALLATGVLGLVVAGGLFYGRYVPVFLDMRQGIPQPEEQVLLDLQERRARVVTEEAAEGPDDPYALPHFSAFRGVEKAAWRLWLFWGPFAMVIPLGVARLVRAAPPELRRVLVAWAGLYLALNFASGSLPGPNLFRYNKDLEIVAPLCALALCAWPTDRPRWRRVSMATWLAMLAYGAWRVAETFGRITPPVS